MIRNIIILVLIVVAIWLGVQNYYQREEIRHLNANMAQAKLKILHLTHRPFKTVADGPKDYLGLAAKYAQLGETALANHDAKHAAKYYGFAKLALAKAAKQRLAGQSSAIASMKQRVGKMAGQLKQLTDALRG